jgi:hypothetical protein
MPLVKRPRALAAVVLGAACLACGTSTPTSSTGLVAFLTLAVTPNPVVSTLYSTVGPTYAATWTVSIVESAGEGGTVQFVKSSVYDNTTGALLATSNFDDKDLQVFVGSSRVEANSALAVPQQATFAPSTGVGKAATLVVVVTFKDDAGNVQEKSILAKVE